MQSTEKVLKDAENIAGIEYLSNRFDSALYGMCEPISASLSALPKRLKASVYEIRIRSGQPVALSAKDGTVFLNLAGGVSLLPRTGLLVSTKNQIEDTFNRLCKFSVYTHQQELNQGFIIMNGGHRAGICGTVVHEQGNIITVKDIFSINIRISKEIKGCADKFLHQMFGSGHSFRDGILIAGAPGCGKTTILRDLARQLSSGASGSLYRTAVIDERGEIAAVNYGESPYDLGPCCDVITGCPKAAGIQMAVRTLSPDIIVFDEIGTAEEVEAVEDGINTGAGIVTTIHAGSLSELSRRPQAVRLIESGAVGIVALISGVADSAEIKLYKAEDVYAEIYRTGHHSGSVSGSRDIVLRPSRSKGHTA